MWFFPLSRWAQTCLMGLGLASVCSSLSGQDTDLLQPKEPDFGYEGRVEAAAEPERPAGTDRVLIEKLQGLVFVGNLEAFQEAGRDVTGIHFISVPVLEEKSFAPEVESLLGEPFTLNDLQRLLRGVVQFHRDHDRPVVDALAPEQNIGNGVIQILVLEGHIGEIITEGNVHFSDRVITRYLGSGPGDRIHGRRLMDDIHVTNRNPFRQTDLIYARGNALAETDLILRTYDRPPWSLYGGYENTGTELLGFDRYFAGFNWGNVLGRDHQMNYQFTRSGDNESLKAHSFSYIWPLANHHRIWAFGSYSESSADLPAPLALEGESWRLSGRYTIPLASLKDYRHEVTFGADAASSDNTLEFGQIRLNNTATNLFQSMASYNGTLKKKRYNAAFALTAYASPGGLNDANETQRLRQARTGATSDYWYLRFEGEQTWRVNDFLTWRTELQGQWTDARLLASEQFGLGGYNSVRGYELNEATTDRAYLIRNEWRFPVIPVVQDPKGKKWGDSLRMHLFWDYAEGRPVRPLAAEDPHVILSGVGAGLRYHLGTWLTLRLDWGFQLKDSGQSQTGHNDRLAVGVTVRY